MILDEGLYECANMIYQKNMYILYECVGKSLDISATLSFSQPLFWEEFVLMGSKF